MAYLHILDALNTLTGNSTPANSTIDVNGVSLDIEFQEYSTAQTISANTNLGSATADTIGTLVKYDSDLTIDIGKTLSTSARKRGLYVLVKGNCVINGTLTQTARGASAAGQNVRLYTGYDVPATGAAGGVWVSGNGVAGSNGTTIQSGGAGSGSSDNTTGASGGAGTSYSGGAGGGGGGAGTNPHAGSSSGGAGGAYDTGYSGVGTLNIFSGGTGNPGGAGGNVTGNDGTGGLVVLLVLGNLTFGTSSIIAANGVAGANCTGGSNRNLPGGASGGGISVVLYRGTLTNGGLTHQANGGAAGVGSGGSTSNFNGGPGGNGTTTLTQDALILPTSGTIESGYSFFM